jgi:hypothetical protein
MGKFKILAKKGTANWKEKKLLKDLEPILERKMVTDSNFASNFRPVNSYEDLQKLHNTYCAENAEIVEEITNEKTNMSDTKETEHVLSNDKNINLNETKTTVEDVLDPFNRQEPRIRDYVLKEDQFDKNSSNIQSTENVSQIFDEPTNFNDAFNIPDFNDDDKNQIGDNNHAQQGTNNLNQQGAGNNNNTTDNSRGTQPESPKKDNKQSPVNPYFEDQSNQNKKKQTKRFAKYITGFVCFALEKGYVWYATKDINEAKLIEYELKGQIDLSLVLTLDSNTTITAKEFFTKMCGDAKIAAKISPDDQDELADALSDVLMEKGIAPTPMQTLLMVGGQILAKQAINAFTSVSISKNIIEGLKEHKINEEQEAENLMKDVYEESKKTVENTDKTEDDSEYVEAEEA